MPQNVRSIYININMKYGLPLLVRIRFQVIFSTLSFVTFFFHRHLTISLLSLLNFDIISLKSVNISILDVSDPLERPMALLTLQSSIGIQYSGSFC